MWSRVIPLTKLALDTEASNERLVFAPNSATQAADGKLLIVHSVFTSEGDMDVRL